MDKCFSTTNWQVKDGMQEQFVERWTSFLTWTRESQEGLEGARRVVSEEDPLRFLSVGEWRDPAARQAWQDEPRFMEFVLPCLELCDDMQSSQYEIKLII